MKQTLLTMLATALLTAMPSAVHAQYTYTTNNGAITITGYNGPGGNVTIPDTITGLLVTCIGSGAFMRCSSLTSVTIPNSVKSIGDSAFASCTSLVSVTLPDSLTNVGNDAFDFCLNLTGITIPKSVTFIGYRAFIDCRSLTAITVDALNSSYRSVDGVLFDKGQTTLIQCPVRNVGSYSVANSVTRIESTAFYRCTGLTSVTIPSSVKSIGDSAFAYCSNLTNINLPNGITSLGINMFYACSSLTSVIIPNGLTTIATYAFFRCTSLTNVTIGSNVTTIGESAFYGCTALANVTIPNSVTTVGIQAFLECASLTRVTIGSGVTSIRDAAFLYCGGLTSVYCTGNSPSVGASVFGGVHNATVYYLPGTTGWGATFGGRPTALWLPEVLTGDASFGVRTNQFGFNIAWASGQTVAVDACTDLTNPIWSPLQTNTLTSGSSYFSDPAWTNYPGRFYRLRSP